MSRAFLSIVVLLFCARVDSPEASFEKARERAAGALVIELAALAEWCGSAKLFASRELTWREVLRLDPQNQKARKGLGHQPDGKGGWREPQQRRAPRDHAPDALAEYAARRARAVQGYCAALLDALGRLEAPLSGPRVETLREELIALAPDDPRVRGHFGEVRSEDGWVLLETVVAKERRALLKDMVRAAYEGLEPPRAGELVARERDLGLPFNAVREAPGLRVLGTGEPEEVETVSRALQAARALFNGAFGTEATFYGEGTVFVLAHPGEKETFLERHPEVPAESREFLSGLECTGIQGTSDMVHWGATPVLRLDGVTRMGLGWLLYDAFRVTSDVGWVFEGLGIYVTRELVGTRLTWFVQPSEYMPPKEEAALRARLLKPGTNWMDEAHRVLQSGRAPRLSFVMGKTVNNMTPEDMLSAYATAVYLLEGRPNEMPELLRRIGAGKASQVAVEEVLGMDVMQLEQRVRRWLGERR